MQVFNSPSIAQITAIPGLYISESVPLPALPFSYTP
jgi:hypothetical protein